MTRSNLDIIREAERINLLSKKMRGSTGAKVDPSSASSDSEQAQDNAGIISSPVLVVASSPQEVDPPDSDNPHEKKSVKNNFITCKASTKSANPEETSHQEATDLSAVSGRKPSLKSRMLSRSQSCGKIEDGTGESEQEIQSNSGNPSRRYSYQSPGSSASSTKKNSRKQPASSDSSCAMDGASSSSGVLKKINGIGKEADKDAKRLFGFFKRKLRGKRGGKETAVKEIHIAPEEDDDRWAARPMTSSSSGNNSRASSGHNSGSSSSRENSHLEVVHDMEDEYNPEFR